MVNDGSRDDSLKKIRKFQNNIQIKLISNKSNRGLPALI